jgi:hypothetical protein
MPFKLVLSQFFKKASEELIMSWLNQETLDETTLFNVIIQERWQIEFGFGLTILFLFLFSSHDQVYHQQENILKRVGSLKKRITTE